LIASHASITDIPLDLRKDDTVAIDHAISGYKDDVEIPEAKYAGQPEELPGESKKTNPMT
jgi:hypothetical protein